MTLDDILYNVRQLSPNDKLALIEATVQMLREKPDTDGVRFVAKIAAPYITEEMVITRDAIEIDFDEVSDRELDDLLHAHLTGPNPEPHQMLPYGLFKGMNFTEEDFRAAEWHPSAEDLAGD